MNARIPVLLLLLLVVLVVVCGSGARAYNPKKGKEKPQTDVVDGPPPEDLTDGDGSEPSTQRLDPQGFGLISPQSNMPGYDYQPFISGTHMPFVNNQHNSPSAHGPAQEKPAQWVPVDQLQSMAARIQERLHMFGVSAYVVEKPWFPSPTPDTTPMVAGRKFDKTKLLKDAQKGHQKGANEDQGTLLPKKAYSPSNDVGFVEEKAAIKTVQQNRENDEERPFDWPPIIKVEVKARKLRKQLANQSARKGLKHIKREVKNLLGDEHPLGQVAYSLLGKRRREAREWSGYYGKSTKNPLQGGVSLSQANEWSYGTMSGFLMDGRDDLFVLTNQHVLPANKTHVCQPSTAFTWNADKGRTTCYSIAKRLVASEVSKCKLGDDFDFAVARVTKGRRKHVKCGVKLLGDIKGSGSGSVDVGTTIYKAGVRTHKTRGKVNRKRCKGNNFVVYGTNVFTFSDDKRSEVKWPDGTGKSAYSPSKEKDLFEVSFRGRNSTDDRSAMEWLVNDIGLTEVGAASVFDNLYARGFVHGFSMGGDSGSFYLNSKNEVVGLHFAGWWEMFEPPSLWELWNLWWDNKYVSHDGENYYGINKVGYGTRIEKVLNEVNKVAGLASNLRVCTEAERVAAAKPVQK